MDKSEDKPAVPRPKDGIFSNWEDLKLYYQYRKDKSTEPFVPVVLEHFKRKKQLQLFIVKPNMPIKNMFRFIQSKLAAKEKQAGRDIGHNDSVYFFYKKSKVMVRFDDDEKVQDKYDKLKDEDGLLCLSYHFSYEIGYSPDGYEIAAILLLMPLALPIIATVAIFDWTSKTLKKISVPSLPSLPSVRLPVFRSKTHKFEYKAKFPLEQRREMFQAFHQNHPEQIGVILERHQSSQLPELPFLKFAVSPTLNYRHFCAMLQTRISKAAGKPGEQFKHSIFFVIASQIPSHETLLEEVYSKYKDEDGMLYVVYQEQESF